MEPDPSYEKSLTDEETKRLTAKLEGLGGESAVRNNLVKQEQELIEFMEKARKQDISCLPSLTVEDIPREGKKIPMQHGKIGDIPVQWRTSSTNGLTYFRAINPLDDLPEELRMYLPLFTDAILRLGTAKKSVEEIEDQIKLKTGGLSASTHIANHHSSLDITEEGLVFSGTCQDKYVPDMLELLRTILLETNFYAVSKLRTLIQGSASGFVNSLAESGHHFAFTFASAHLTPARRAEEVMGGMTQVRLISSMAASEIYNDALEKLREIAKFAGRQNGLRVFVTCGSDAVSDNEAAIKKFLDGLPIAQTPPRTSPLFDLEAPTKAFFPLPYQVSYVASCVKTVPYTHKDRAALQLLKELLTHKHLHHEIREKGGAYGGGAFHHGGIFGLYSYRDPNVANTLKIMQTAGQWAVQNDWTDRDLNEAKLSVFQVVDAPTSISQDGTSLFYFGITDEMVQTHRERYFDTTIDDIRRVAQTYLVDQMGKEAIAVLGDSKEWVDETWTVFPLSLDPSKFGPPGDDRVVL